MFADDSAVLRGRKISATRSLRAQTAQCIRNRFERIMWDIQCARCPTTLVTQLTNKNVTWLSGRPAPRCSPHLQTAQSFCEMISNRRSKLSEAALDTFAEIPASRRIVVLGQVSEVGGHQHQVHRHLGERVAQIAAYAIFVGMNCQSYITGSVRGGPPRTAILDAGKKVSIPRMIEVSACAGR